MSSSTLFRAKSVSKTFTATAVMQLVEEGEVDLLADVTSYLPGFTLPGFTLPGGNDPPITLDQLLTHTSGISDRGIGTMSRDREEAIDLRGYLEARMPPRLARPGTVFSYTDHGISLAGLVVEEVSGLPFARYMRERILGPLGMDQSAFDPPLDGRPDLAAGYQLVGGSFRPAPVGYFHVAPAVALVTSAHDMGAFLIAMLEGGGSHRSVLRPETVQLMESTHFALQPDGPGIAYGLFEWPRNVERVLVHGGLGHGFSALLVLLPARRERLFIATNSDEPDLRWDLLRAFMDRFYPAEEPPPPGHIAASDLGRFAGVYRDYRYDGGSHELLGEAFDEGRITVNDDGTLSLSWMEGRWVEVEPLLFENLDDPYERLAFQADADGRITRVLAPPDEARVKVSWFGTLQAFAAGVLLFAALFVSAAVVWLVTCWRRLRRRKESGPRWSRRARALAGLVGLLNLGFLVGVPLLLLPYAGLNGSDLDFGVPLRFNLVFSVPVATTALGIPMVGAAALLWRKKAWGLAARIHFAAVAAGALVFPLFLSYWKLFGPGG